MINNNLTMNRNSKMSAFPYVDLSKQGKKAKEYKYYRNIRARFLQESANYLGADLTSRKVLSLCFADNTQRAAQFSE
jgi:hypothetical protein